MDIKYIICLNLNFCVEAKAYLLVSIDKFCEIRFTVAIQTQVYIESM